MKQSDNLLESYIMLQNYVIIPEHLSYRRGDEYSRRQLLVTAKEKGQMIRETLPNPELSQIQLDINARYNSAFFSLD